MLEAIAGTAIEYVANLGVDAAREKLGDKIDEQKLRSALAGYIERQRKYNEAVTLSEEIDFQGLVEYIHDEMLDDVEKRLFSPSKKERGQARQSIIDKACIWAKANTDQAKYRVSTSIAICLDIIHDFYSKKISRKDYILTAEIVDAVAEIDNENTQRVITTVENSTQVILNTLNDGSLFSLDKAVKYAQAGQVDQVETGIRTVLKHMSLEHPLYPYYGYDYSHDRVVSKPLTAEAKKLYPEKYKFTGALKIGGEYFNDPTGDPIDYAYRHQLPIMMEVSKAVRYLGDVIDPAQSDMQNLKELHANPPEFPPAFACAIKIEKETYFDYILLRTREILDDGRIVLNNKEQDSHIHFGLILNPADPSHPDFKISIKDANNKELLQYTRFMKDLQEKKDLHVYVLEAGEDLVAGLINSFDLHTGFSSVDEELDFLERICAIENYFDVVLNVSGEISAGEYNAVVMISDLVRNEEVKGSWKDSSFTGTIDQHFREQVLEMEDIEHELSYVGTHAVDLFGAEFEFRFMRTLKCARFDDLAKIRKKLEVLDDGESIKITLVSGEDKTSIETIRIPEQFKEPA